MPKGSLLPGGPGRGAGGGSSLRTLRWAMPVLLTAVLSSYMLYLFLYSGRPNQHAADGHAWGQLRSSGRTTSSAGAHSSLQAGAAAALPGAHRYAPQDAAFQWVKAAGRRMRVAVVNDAPFHLEIVAGLLQVLGGMPVDVTWYQAKQETAEESISPTELVERTGFTQLLGYLPLMRPTTKTPSPCDYAILVSPEYYIQQTKAFLDVAKPVTALVLAHNGMNSALNQIQKLHPRLHFAALSPHVAAAARHALHIHTHWLLPTFTFTSKEPCNIESITASTCMHGFSIQGNFESARRNYTRLWQQVEAAIGAGSVPTEPPVRPFHLHLLGRGNVHSLGMPGRVEEHTTVHYNLKFPQYYDQLQHTHALLLLLGNVNYLVQKMSSTVVSSLMTGVPIIADSQVLASYTFLKPEHVFLIGPGETEMDVMQRVVRMSPAEVFAVRQKVLDLQQLLNRRAFAVLQAFMPLVEDIPEAPDVA